MPFKKLFIGMVLLLTSTILSPVFGQGEPEAKAKPIHGIGLQASLVKMNKLKVESLEGDVSFSTKPKLSQILELYYSRRIPNGLTLNAGVGFGFLGYSYTSQFKPKPNTAFWDSLVEHGYDPNAPITLSNSNGLQNLLNFSFILGKEFKLSKRSSFGLSGGMQLMLGLNTGWSMSSQEAFRPPDLPHLNEKDTSYIIHYYKHYYSEMWKPLFNVLVDISYSYQLRSYNYLGVSAVINLGVSELGHGIMKVIPDGHQASGRTSLGTSYFGFKLAYIYTINKKQFGPLY